MARVAEVGVVDDMMMAPEHESFLGTNKDSVVAAVGKVARKFPQKP